MFKPFIADIKIIEKYVVNIFLMGYNIKTLDFF